MKNTTRPLEKILVIKSVIENTPFSETPKGYDIFGFFFGLITPLILDGTATSVSEAWGT